MYDRSRREWHERPIRQREIAAKLGVSVRTFRRWKNEGIEPRFPQRAAKLDRVYAREARSIRASLARDRARHPEAPDLREIPPVHASRRKLKERDPRTGQETGREFDSSWLNFDVRGWTLRELHDLLVRLWRQGARRNLDFQFIYLIPAGAHYPKKKGERGTRVQRSTRTGTTPIPFRMIESESELLELLMRYHASVQGPRTLRLLYIAVNDKRFGPAL